MPIVNEFMFTWGLICCRHDERNAFLWAKIAARGGKALKVRFANSVVWAVTLYNVNTKGRFNIMAFDGITIANIVHELKECLLDGRINKIAQPETDELLLTIKTPKGQKRLSISASASLPLIYLTETNKPSPMTAPNFCMLLRKHINLSLIHI